MKKYLVAFAHTFVEFRIPELISLCELGGVHVNLDGYSDSHPYCVLQGTGTKELLDILSRSVLIQFILEIWEHCQSREELCDAKFHDISPVGGTFNILLHSFARKVSLEQKIELVEKIKYLPLTGNVDCNDPDQIIYICERYAQNSQSGPPIEVIIGKLLGRSNRNIIEQLSLKKRPYIGRTSMDAQLSLVMANIAKVKSGDLVYDPFLGTGSLSIPSSLFGAYTLGSDIDLKALHGWGKSTRAGEGTYQPSQSISGNMEWYGVSKLYIGSHSADFTSPLIRDAPLFDAIVTDPPYGVREASLKTTKGLKNSQYALSEQFLELLNFAARVLVIGGRLVYWLPVMRGLYHDSSLPRHPSLTLKYNSEQVLNRKSSRRLLVMEKTGVCLPEESAFVPGDESCHGQFRELYFSKSGG